MSNRQFEQGMLRLMYKIYYYGMIQSLQDSFCSFEKTVFEPLPANHVLWKKPQFISIFSFVKNYQKKNIALSFFEFVGGGEDLQ